MKTLQIRNAIIAASLLTILMFSASSASAQWRSERRYRDDRNYSFRERIENKVHNNDRHDDHWDRRERRDNIRDRRDFYRDRRDRRHDRRDRCHDRRERRHDRRH